MARSREPESDPLQALLYLLMRDHVPVGVIAAVVEDLEAAADGDQWVFSNDGLADIAKDFARRIRG